VIRALSLTAEMSRVCAESVLSGKVDTNRDKERLLRLRQQISRQLVKTSLMVRKTENVLK